MGHRDSHKRREVAREYVNNGFNLAKALKTVEHDKPYKHEHYIFVKAKRWRDDPKLLEEVKKVIAKFDKSIINENYVLANLYEITEDDSIKTSDRVAALTLIAKILALTKEGSQNVAVFGDMTARLDDLLSKRIGNSQKAVNNAMLEESVDTNTIPKDSSNKDLQQ